MSNDTKLTVYELGIIKNFLRDRLISIKIKEFRTDYLAETKEEINERADAFGLELTAIRDKVEVMISSQSDVNSQLIKILPNSKRIAKPAVV
ncbi:hypothetical protein [Psychrobacter immobilis]|uniref:hypothetical protein n=1 Tax=Psychrobacter immobilis TaxID=498 RepID=UPI00191A91AF|nr:hypothetical protein [Psychrobacter immobilis]